MPKLVVPDGACLVKGRRPKLQKRRTNAWTKAKQAKFLAMLAESCNVTLSAETAKVSSSSVYKRRRTDAAFRAAWGEAMAEGYAALELEMLKRALHGIEKTSVTSSGEKITIRMFDDRTAMALLRMHRDSVETAKGPIDPADVEEARARIVDRLSRLREKMETVETKSAADVIALIRWAIGRR